MDSISQFRANLRQCSRRDRQIVDSFKVNLPFVRIETDKNYASVTVMENRIQVLRVTLSKRKLRLRKKTVVQISDSIEGEYSREFHSTQDFDFILESFLSAISHRNITIDILNLALKHPQGTRIIGELNTNWQSGRMMLAGKRYNIVPTGHYADIGKITFWKPSLLECNLGALISGILWRMSTEMEYYYIPGLEVVESEYEEITRRFEGRMTRHGQVTVLHITNENAPERKLLVKITKCGVIIQKSAFDAILNIPKDQCLFDWMCSKCDNSVASWYFRKTNGLEN
uniref:FBA_2 domain-containing protein n=1 Tax=Caenorhabditis tropicalis TaxID=1561998 RepID=A0A1I7SYA9_9PELO